MEWGGGGVTELATVYVITFKKYSSKKINNKMNLYIKIYYNLKLEF